MKTTSIKQKIYRVAYAVIGFALMVAVTLGITQSFMAYYTKQADAGAQGLRFINRAEMNYAYYVSNLRGYMLAPDHKEFKEESLKHNKIAREDLIIAGKETENPKFVEIAKQVAEVDKALNAVEAKMLTLLEDGDRKGAEKIYYEQHVGLVEKLEGSLGGVRKMFVEDRDAAMASRERVAMIDYLLMALILLGSTAAIVTYSFRLAKNISEMLENISSELSTAASSVKSVSGSVSVASQTLSETTTQQAAAIEETVSSMEEMSSMLSQTAQNSQTTMQVSEEGQHEGERGKAVIAKMLSAMDEIHSSNERLESIVKLIEQIQSKTKVINDIVFETRLLSFNASIEAARAGAHGKGFAVVAEEVGKLASMSGKAAEEIRTLLESSTAEVISVVHGTKERVDAGRQVSQDCQVVFDVMSTSLEKIGASVRMITAATKEQEQGVKQTNQAMGEMDQVTQKNSASAESLASQAGQLSNGAQQLLHSADALRAVVFGSAEAVPVSKAPVKSFEEALPMTNVKEIKTFTAPKRIEVEPSKQADLDRSDSRWKVG